MSVLRPSLVAAYALAVSIAPTCNPPPEPPVPSGPSAEDLVDEAAPRGLAYVNRSGEPAKATILEANGAGVAMIDLGGDGDLDLVFTQGLASLKQIATGPGADVEVFENDGSGRFARRAGPGLAGWWTGIASGDVDGDGDTDLVVAGFGDVALLLQDKRSVLTIAPASGVAPTGPYARLAIGAAREKGKPPLWASSVALFDADRDGALDLYIGQYLDLDPVDPPLDRLGEGPLSVPCRWKGHDVFCGPRGMNAQPDRVLRGNGDGTFEDVTSAWLPGHVPGFTLGVLPFDADGDGDTDVFVANDSSPNLMLINDGGLDGQCTFRDVAQFAGVALGADGRMQAAMGAAAGDVDRDGRVDLSVTYFSDEPTSLYLGAERGFSDATFRFGLARETLTLLSWGVHLFDADGDGWLDLFTANGHVYPQADLEHTGTRYGQAATLWRLGPEFRAKPYTAADERSLLAPAIGARGSAIGDVDRDGAPDVVLVRIDAPAGLGLNRLGPANHRVAIRCLGPETPAPESPRTNRDGIGTRVIVIAGSGADEQAWVGECQTASGYQSASSPWVHIGLGARTTYSHLQVRWPSGRIEELPGGAADRHITVREGSGVIASEAFR